MQLRPNKPQQYTKYVKWVSWQWIRLLSLQTSNRSTIDGLPGVLVNLYKKNPNGQLLKTIISYFYPVVQKHTTKYHAMIRRWNRQASLSEFSSFSSVDELSDEERTSKVFKIKDTTNNFRPQKSIKGQVFNRETSSDVEMEDMTSHRPAPTPSHQRSKNRQISYNQNPVQIQTQQQSINRSSQLYIPQDNLGIQQQKSQQQLTKRKMEASTQINSQSYIPETITEQQNPSSQLHQKRRYEEENKVPSQSYKIRNPYMIVPSQTQSQLNLESQDGYDYLSQDQQMTQHIKIKEDQAMEQNTRTIQRKQKNPQKIPEGAGHLKSQMMKSQIEEKKQDKDKKSSLKSMYDKLFSKNQHEGGESEDDQEEHESSEEDQWATDQEDSQSESSSTMREIDFAHESQVLGQQQCQRTDCPQSPYSSVNKWSKETYHGFSQPIEKDQRQQQEKSKATQRQGMIALSRIRKYFK